MFYKFRQKVKEYLKSKDMTYLQLSELTGFKESTIKCFMCGANNSRRIAEKIASALGMKMIYQNDKWDLYEEVS